MAAWVLIGAAVVAAPLDLTCVGQYADTETITTDAGAPGELWAGSTSTRTVMRPGVARVRFDGAGGLLTYPDGRERELELVGVTEASISATYSRRALFRQVAWNIRVDRMTGGIVVSSDGRVAFNGLCEPTGSAPRF